MPLPVIFKLAEAVPVRYRALMLLATFADMRWGELAGLRRGDIDLGACEIRITQTLVQLAKGGLRPDTPKSRAGKRTVAFPEEIVPEIGWHLDRFAEPGERDSCSSDRRAASCAARTSTSRSGARREPRWACRSFIFMTCGIQAALVAAASGATLKELMARLGHSSVRAAMIYQHATRDRDQAIAKALGAFVREVRDASGESATGHGRGEQGA